MKIFNQTKTQEIFNPDFMSGHIVQDKLLIRIESAVAAVTEQGHYETFMMYPETGGKDVKWIIDVLAVQAKEAKEIYADIQVYIPFTAVEIEAQYKARRSHYFDAYRKYQAAVNYGEFERVMVIDEVIESLRNKDWAALTAIPPQLKYFAGEVGFVESGLIRR